MLRTLADRINRKARPLAVIASACAVVAACFNLDVVAIQPVAGTNYTRDSVLKDPGLMELAIASSFVAFWSGINTERPNVVLSILGEEISTSVLEYDINNDPGSRVFDHVSEPRGEFNNNVDGGNRVGRDPWGFFYEGNSASAELGGHIKRNNIRVIDPATNADNTTRVLAFAKWMMGMAHVHLGILFDSGAIVNEDVDLTVPTILPLRGYQEVLDSGIKWLEESIVLSESEAFVLPLNRDIWIYQTGVSSQQLAAIAHSYIARALVYGARTPSDPVDWERVKFHVARGTNTPFGPRGASANSFINFLYKRAVTSPSLAGATTCGTGNANVCSFPGYFRVDNRLLGPADTSGNYQAWLLKVSQPRFDTVAPFDIFTPDARIQAPGGTEPSLSAPVYFKHTTLWPAQAQMDTALRGRYYVSWYWNSTRARDNRTQFPITGGGRNRNNDNDLRFIQDDMMVPAEMDLLMAEAEYRTGNLGAAAILINKSRETNGELPPVSAAGVPVANSCVPQRWDGTCGDLFDALMYEKRIETYGTGIAFYDLRRWGCLLEGTFTQLPVPGQQRLIMNRPNYTYGGHPGELGSAPKPTSCPLLHHP